MSETSASPMYFHPPRVQAVVPRNDAWTRERIEALLDQPFMALIQRAHAVHREHFPALDIELASLLSVKTGGCPEDCGYCPQSIHHSTGVTATKLMDPEEVLSAARAAQAAGASRFCIGAAPMTVT